VAEPIKLAVLPFENLTGDPNQEYFSDGLTDEMITQLGRLHPQRLSVIARTSSMQYKSRGIPIDQIGRELGVDFLLEGSARREGNRVRINATLIQVRDQGVRWADSFDRDLAGILALQSDVARSVAGALRLTLLPREDAQLGSAVPVNPDAFDAYLKGRFHAEKETQADLDLAFEYFELALQKDPKYAPAYAGITFVWASRNQNGYVSPSEARPRARAAAIKALEVDSTLAIAHYALAGVAWAEWDWETSEREVKRAIELDPSDSSAPALYAFVLIALRRPDESVSQAERAIQLDPLNAFNQALYGTVLYLVRRYDEAVAQYQKALKTTPESSIAQCGLWYTYSVTGKGEQALKAAEECLGHYNGRDIKDVLAQGNSEAGYAGAMRRVGDRLAAGFSGTYVAPIDVFAAYSYAGQKELALEWLAKSIDARDPNVAGAVRNPFVVDSLGRDPRFQELVRRTKLPL
jgi:TolB-like protein/tetratricopeptide (TPR) repeat protein